MSRPMLSLVIAVVLLGVGCLSAHAATFYVSTAGADSVTCAKAQSAQTPRRTINQGIACLSSGDTLVIGPGHYHELLTNYSGVGSTPIPNGSAGAYTTLKAATAGTVRLTLPPSGDIWNPIAVSDSAAYLQFEGFDIDGQQYQTNGIDIGHGATSLRFKDLTIHHVLAMGIEGGGT